MMTANILVIGGGGREHCITWKLAQSSQINHIYVSPGNAGTQNNGKISNVSLDVKKFDEIIKWCKEKSIGMVMVGPEDPLAAGLSDHLSAGEIACFGPSAKAAQIEASKEFAKEFMSRHEIPTARFETFTDVEKACQHIRSVDYKALVVKASGLAAGKGVIVAENKDEACKAVHSMLKDKVFGPAGSTIIVEELLEGEEVSCLAFTDGTTVSLMPPSQDHKRLLDRDEGPNTGGMGAYCPYTKLKEPDLKEIKRTIIQKAVDGMKSEGITYVGVLYAGLMLTSSGPKVLEFNCRFGDPETQVILPLLKSDLYNVCKACVTGTLKENLPEFHSDLRVLGVVVVSGGYPGAYKKGEPISGLDDAERLGLTIFHAGTAVKNNTLVTSGGRVLAVVAMENDFHSASRKAQEGAGLVKFADAFYRKDIGYRMLFNMPGKSLSYKDSGVDISAGNDLVEAIKPLATMTSRPGCTSRLGSFGALFDLKACNYRDPILISGTDGVGTKLKVAQSVGRHNTVGVDLVAMCVNDILAHGAEPLFFLDYFSTGKLDVSAAQEVISGIAKGCLEAGCALAGGETAEMPGMYSGSDYDLAGFAVGAVERDKMLPKLDSIQQGDVMIGLSSSGLHSNGFSLVREVVQRMGLSFQSPSPFTADKTLGEELLTPTRIYVKSVLACMRAEQVKGFAHITGGGLVENIPRVLPDLMAVQLDATCWRMPPVFGWLSENGDITEGEMMRTFNCGVGAVLIVGKSQSQNVIKHLERSGEEAAVIGVVVDKRGGQSVVIENLQQALYQSWRPTTLKNGRKKIGVLISGSGTNLQALIDHTIDPKKHSAAEIVLVISNKAGVQGLQRAERAGISTKVINHKDFTSRAEFDSALNEALTTAQVDLVCLAGFMRILTGDFVRKWSGRMLNVHPSLLPSFKGANAHKLVLEAGVRLSGCSVHFVTEEVDAGAILVQDCVQVYPGDTEETLAERVKAVEHRAYPHALELLASGKAKLQEDGKVQWTS